MKIAYFDCFAGISGDMILGALIDAGLDVDELRQGLQGLGLSEYDLQVSQVHKGAIGATSVTVAVRGPVPERKLANIEQVIEESDLPAAVKEQSLSIFRRLIDVESEIHGADPAKVHLHEVGGTDAIVDVVGSLLGLKLLGVGKVYASRLPLGHGFVRCAHGLLPVPAPATLALLRGLPVVQYDVEGELVTPTGAAILTSLAEEYGPLPRMTVEKIGYGAGKRDFPFPNLLRVLVGSLSPAVALPTEDVVLLETNLDDMNPELYDHVMDSLFDAGALDVFLQPFQGKKNRPGVLLCVLCHPHQVDQLSSIVFAETTTLGIRQTTMERRCLDRDMVMVDTVHGQVRVKVARLDGDVVNLSPEYEDCRRLARETGKPLKEVYAAAQAAAMLWRDSRS
ncbi:MAG TPA: nickel pincer cofactor biosynthesis protein LarC [Anaerolineae bacterium]|jgi:uncharacterized protein (TIGR00299 family) protein|nr:nickel pincer cofactor biosynthesis protein LarC [Anaerolineae bacterium]